MDVMLAMFHGVEWFEDPLGVRGLSAQRSVLKSFVIAVGVCAPVAE